MKYQDINFLVNGEVKMGVITKVELDEVCINGNYMVTGEIYTVLGEDFETIYKVHESDLLSVNIYL